MDNKKAFSKPVIIIAGVILALLIFGPSYYFYSKYNEAQKKLQDSSVDKKEEVKSLVAKVGKLIELPQEEEPTIATVSDKSSLPNQPFFANAKNGDQVLIYSKAKKAILYRPATNKIIEVGPVNFEPTGSPTPTGSGNNSSQLLTPSPSITNLVRLAIYNAGKTAGLAASTEAKLKTQFKNITVVQKSNTQGDFSANLVVDLSGKQKEAATQLASFLNAELGTLPSSETKPDSDILVIVVK